MVIPAQPSGSTGDSIVARQQLRFRLSQCGRGTIALAFFVLQAVAIFRLPGPVVAAEPIPAMAAAPTASDAEINKLVAQLGDDDYYVRQWAQNELARLKYEAFDALTVAENHADLEIADRARYLLRSLRVDLVQDQDPAEVKKILDRYFASDRQDRLGMVEELAKLSGDRGLTALCRLVRFDRIQVVSKTAALRIITPPAGVEAQSPTSRSANVLASLGRSPRVGAEWLRTYLTSVDQTPPQIAEAWSKIASAELLVLQKQPNQSAPEVVYELLKLEALAWHRVGSAERATAAMLRMLDVDTSDSQSLGDLLSWLADQQAWTVLDQAAERFKDRFEQDTLLLYTLAAACEAQGKTDLAADHARRALKLNQDDQKRHYDIAWQLRRRGLRKWSEGEFRRTIEIGPADDDYTVKSQIYLGEMLHDAGTDVEAAKVAEELVATLVRLKRPGQRNDQLELLLRNQRGQMHYYFACAALAAKQADEHRDQLVRGLAQDPSNADILIGLYRIPNLDDELKQRTMRAIREAAESFRSQILQSPDDPIAYNQLAWLIANTEGDFQEAVRCSQKSLELRPNEAGYLDTLGRCYFAVGDVDLAVKTQAQAVALDPHSGLLRRQLAQFKEAQAAKSGRGP